MPRPTLARARGARAMTRPALSAGAALRPGAVLGAYPQREDRRPAPLDVLGVRISGMARRRLRVGAGGAGAFLDAVRRQERILADAEPARRARVLDEVREQLGRAQVEPSTVATAFAFVCLAATRILGGPADDDAIRGGWTLFQGRVAELGAGDDTRLCVALAAGAAALGGVPVHVVTTGDARASQAAARVGPLLEPLGLTCAALDAEMDRDARRHVYAQDVAFCAHRQIMFDYLRDRLLLTQRAGKLRMELEGLHESDPRVARVALRGLCFAIVDEADEVLLDRARSPLVVSREGGNQGQRRMFQEAVELARALEPGVDFSPPAPGQEVVLAEPGRFRLAGLAGRLGGVWSGSERRELLVRQALQALHGLVRDRDYRLDGNAIRPLARGVVWDPGMRQMLEVKESLPVTVRPDTLGRISHQRFFRRYLRLAGMTATAREAAAELWEVYRLDVESVRRGRERATGPARRLVYRSTAALDEALLARIGALRSDTRPVLLVAPTEAEARRVAATLAAAGIPHHLPGGGTGAGPGSANARADAASRVALVTGSTIRDLPVPRGDPQDRVAAPHVILLGACDSRRVERQVAMRCAATEAEHALEQLVSLDDERVCRHCPDWIAGPAGGGAAARPLRSWRARLVLALACRGAEREAARARRDLMQLDDHLTDVLAFSGRPE